MKRQDRMKILIVSTPTAGHLNPLLAIGRILMDAGHDVAVLTGSPLRDRVEAAGARFHAFPAGADIDLHKLDSIVPEMKTMPPGPERRRLTIERIFIDTVPAQYKGLKQVLKSFHADVVLGEDKLFGLLPMLLGPHAKRPPVVLCGPSVLHWCPDDSAANLALLSGIPVARREKEDRLISSPLSDRLNELLGDLGAKPMSMHLFDAAMLLADAYLQLTVPGFEFPRDIPKSVHFVGTPPIIAGQADLPPWADEIDGSRKIVLVTQGTVANNNFGLLLAPTLQALADEPDVLVVATAGGRPIDAIPGPIPANVRLARYLPFEWMLPKVDVFVTNGGYGSVNQAMSFGIPLVTAGLTEDKADVNARVAWSGVGINLDTNEPSPQAIRAAVREVLDTPDYQLSASLMADEFKTIDTRAEILRIIGGVARPASKHRSQPDHLERFIGGLQ
jgi:MGT family glycosyltransferase